MRTGHSPSCASFSSSRAINTLLFREGDSVPSDCASTVSTKTGFALSPAEYNNQAAATHLKHCMRRSGSYLMHQGIARRPARRSAARRPFHFHGYWVPAHSSSSFASPVRPPLCATGGPSARPRRPASAHAWPMATVPKATACWNRSRNKCGCDSATRREWASRRKRSVSQS